MQNLNTLERFVLAKDKNQVLEELAPFQEQYQFFSMLMKLQEGKAKDEEVRSFLNNKDNRLIELKHILQSLKNCQDEFKRKEQLERLNRMLFNETFNDENTTEFKGEGLSNQQQKNHSSELTESFYQKTTLQNHIQDFYDNQQPHVLSRLKDKQISQLDFSKVKLDNRQVVNRIACVLKNLHIDLNNKTLKKFLIDAQKYYEKKPMHELLEATYATPYEMCLEVLKTTNLWKNKNSYEELYYKAFEGINYEKEQVEKVKGQILDRIKFIENGPQQFIVNVYRLRKNLLNYLYEENQTDEDLLLKYLENPLQTDARLVNNQQKQDLNNNLFVSANDEVSLLKILELTLFNQKTTNGKAYEKYFEKNQLDKIVAEVQFLKGEINDLKTWFNEKQIKNLNEKKILEVKGKEQYKQNETVELEVNLKNIKSLNVKVFEVNTENYLINDKTDYNDIDVNFMIPSEEYTYTFNELPQLKHQQKLKFESISSKKMGVFIVNLIGDGQFAKAIIKKGKLALVYDQICGRNCVIVNENQEICISERTGIYIQNKFLKANQETGIITIPQQIDIVSEDVLMVHDKYAVKGFLSLKNFDYKLNFKVLFNLEEIIPGRQVKFVLPTSLLLNQKNVSIEQLKDTKLEVIFQKNNGVNQKKLYQNLDFKNDQDLVQEIIIPSKITQVQFKLSAMVKRDKEYNLSQSQTFYFCRINEYQLFEGNISKNQEGNHILRVYGANGENVQDLKVNIKLQYNTHENKNEVQLCTNENGEINLGHLKDVNMLQVKSKEMEQYFTIEDVFESTDLPNYLYLVENQEFTFQNPKNLKLLNLSTYEPTTQNLFELIKNENQQVKIPGLPKGVYVLQFESQEVQLNVLQGKHMNLNGELIVNDKSITTYKKQKDSLGMNTQHKENQIEVKVLGWTEKTKCHLLLSNYTLQTELRTNMTMSDTSLQESNVHNYSEANCEYYSNGKLNDELIYVINRKGEKSYMGNTLEKPGVILKRKKVKETTQNDENLQKEKRAYKKGGRAYDNLARCMNQMDRQYSPQVNVKLRIQEFLKNDSNQPNQMIPNIKLESDNFSIDKTKLGKYQFIYIYLENENGTVVKEIQNGTHKNGQNDLTLKETRQQGSVFRYDRSMDYMKENTKFNIPHVSRQEFSMIQNNEELMEIFSLLSKNSSIENWKFLGKWFSLSNQEKLKKYDKECCHEFNLFLYYKDQDFFQGVVVPFIQNKKEKSIIDNFLLNNTQQLQSYMIMSQIQNYNVIERVLLYMASINLNNQDFANAVYENLKMKSQLKPMKEEFFKSNFDSILQSSKVEQESELRGTAQNLNLVQNIQPQMMMNQCYRAPANFNAPVRRQLGAQRMNRMNQRMEQECVYDNELEENECLEMNCMMDEAYDDYDSLQEEEQRIQVFKPTEATVEYEEKTYHKENPSMDEKKIWFDIIEHYQKNKSLKYFFSQNFVEVQNNLPEMLFLFSIIDLEFEKQEPKTELVEDDLKVQVFTKLLVLTKEIIKEIGQQTDKSIMIQQRFFDINDKYIYSEENPDLKYEKPVKEFIKRQVYESSLVVTNPSSIPLKVQVIHEIPQGSLPYRSLDTMKIEYLNLNPLQSQTVSMQFYFPSSGKFGCYPATVVQEDEILGISKIQTEIEVKDKKTIVENIRLKDILSSGNINDVKEFLMTRNINNRNIFNIRDILGLLKNKEYYTMIINILRERGYYSRSVWKYSLKHADMQGVVEYLNEKTVFNRLKDVLPYSEDLINIDTFKLLEYYPLVNPRQFSINREERTILNNSFRQTYMKLLQYILFKGKMSNEDKIVMTNYLICQDRIQEAIDLHQQINSEEIKEQNCKMQYDYLSAYLDFSTGYPEFKRAKKICEEYLTYPILTWRNLFIEILNQISEFEETEQIEKIMQENQEKSNQDKAKTEPTFSCEIKNSQIEITHENLKTLKTRFYKIDIEAYFSLHPFQEQNVSQFTYVSPFMEQTITLNEGTNQKTVYNIPKEIVSENLFIEVSSDQQGLSRSSYLNYIPFKLNHYLNNEFGILKVVNPENNKPVPKIYMKCFAKYKNGNVHFYKDGFTDIRGSFDYVSLNKDTLNDIEKFKILVTSDEWGSKMVETKPPVKIGRVEGKAKELISKQWQQRQGNFKSKNAYQNVLF